MKHLHAFLLLLLCFSLSAALAEGNIADTPANGHLLLKDQLAGPCSALTDTVPLKVVFADIGDAAWTDETLSSAAALLLSATRSLCEDAAAYGVYLNFAIEYHFAAAEAAPSMKDSLDWTKALLNSIPPIREWLEEDGPYCTPVLILCNAPGRAFALANYGAESLEYAILYQDFEAKSIRHELLHLYGAPDFYVEETLQAAAEAIFPDSLMLGGTEVDDLTAYIIGWTQELSDSALALLEATAGITEADLESAHDQNTFSGYTTREEADGTYTGTMLGGQYHGWGKRVWNNGESYVGCWEHGEKHGYGVFTWASGTVYTGGFDHDRFVGHATITFSDGNIYEGDMVDLVRQGQGVFYWADGTLYAGEFKNNLQDGYGTYYWASGSVYVGEFVNDYRHGYGVYIGSDGTVMEGQWEMGSLVQSTSESSE